MYRCCFGRIHLFIDVVLADLVDITSSLLVITTMQMTIIYLIESKSIDYPQFLNFLFIMLWKVFNVSLNFFDVQLAQSQLEELTEDIMNMNINKDEHKEDTSSMEPSMDPIP